MIDSFRQGGSEAQATQLARLLHQSGQYEVRVACLNSVGPLKRLLDDAGIRDIRCYSLTSFHDRNAVRQVRLFSQHIRQQKIDIIHTHDFYTNIFGMAAGALSRVPVRIASRRESSKRSAFKRRAERLAYRFAQRVIANCDEVRQQLVREGVSSKKVVTVYNGVDLARIDSHTPLSRRRELERLGLPTNSFRRLVTIVANLREVKDHATFLRAARRIHAEAPDALFVLAGEGPLLEPMRKQAQSLGIGPDTFFPGRCERIPELLRLSDVCVLSSRSEGFSNSVLEYMAARRPVVATDVGGIREAVRDGETGYLVPAGNDELMAARILSLLQEPRRARLFGERGRALIEREFTVQAQLKRIEELYELVLSRGSSKTEVPSRKARSRAHMSDLLEDRR